MSSKGGGKKWAKWGQVTGVEGQSKPDASLGSEQEQRCPLVQSESKGREAGGIRHHRAASKHPCYGLRAKRVRRGRGGRAQAGWARSNTRTLSSPRTFPPSWALETPGPTPFLSLLPPTPDTYLLGPYSFREVTRGMRKS